MKKKEPRWLNNFKVARQNMLDEKTDRELSAKAMTVSELIDILETAPADQKVHIAIPTDEFYMTRKAASDVTFDEGLICIWAKE